MGRNLWKIFVETISFGKHPAITLMPGRIILWALRACGKTSSFFCCQWQSERWKKEMCCGFALFLILFLLSFLIVNFINASIVVWSFVRDCYYVLRPSFLLWFYKYLIAISIKETSVGLNKVLFVMNLFAWSRELWKYSFSAAFQKLSKYLWLRGWWIFFSYFVVLLAVVNNVVF